MSTIARLAVKKLTEPPRWMLGAMAFESAGEVTLGVYTGASLTPKDSAASPIRLS
jgi:hypothetical protein